MPVVWGSQHESGNLCGLGKFFFIFVIGLCSK
uniref:Uncharacterized protein n=1 Tax=Rhizophora mucronata TaxID=61149 RepID=A0A2P2K6D9_RHIMU